MSDADNMRQSQAWRSKFRSRNHDAAHENPTETPIDHGGRDDVPRGKPSVISTQAELTALMARLREAGSFAYDSEFIGELFYVPKLCVLQIATVREVALVDPLAELDLTPLWELLADDSVEKIVHAGSQDMEPVSRMLSRTAKNVVDTQIAAAFAALPYPVSLQRLVQQMLGVRLGKGLTFTHWDQRPLSAQQMRYAADDVRYLPAVWRELKQTIDSSGTMPWVRSECDDMCASTPYQFDPANGYQRVRGAGMLDARQLGVLRELAIWRDNAAREADLPARTVVKDEILIDLARRLPSTDEKLGNIQGLPRQVRVPHGPAILHAIAEGLKTPLQDGSFTRKIEELPRQQFKTDAIVALAQTLCMSRQIDPQMVMSRNDVSEFVHRLSHSAPTSDLKLMRGWRKELLGQRLLELCTAGGTVGFEVREGQVLDGRDVK